MKSSLHMCFVPFYSHFFFPFHSLPIPPSIKHSTISFFSISPSSNFTFLLHPCTSSILSSSLSIYVTYTSLTSFIHFLYPSFLYLSYVSIFQFPPSSSSILPPHLSLYFLFLRPSTSSIPAPPVFIPTSSISPSHPLHLSISLSLHPFISTPPSITPLAAPFSFI